MERGLSPAANLSLECASPMQVPGSTVGGTNVLDAVDALGRLGIDRKRLCAAVGLDVDGLNDLDVRVPTTTVAALFAEAERVTGDRFVGLHAGERADHRGPLIYLFMSSARFEDGVRLGPRFSRLVLDSLRITVETAADQAATVLDPGDTTFAASHHAVEYLLLAFFRGLRRIVGDAYRLIEVHVRHADPGGGAAELSRAFGCPVRFAQRDDRLVYPRDDLRRASHFANPRIKEQLEKFATLTTPAVTLRGRVASIARELLTRGLRVDARTVARRLGMSERSLQRGLRDEQQTFRTVRDAVVREVVEALLSNPQLKLEAVALSVGFADAAALTKAVRRWTGCSPAAYRKLLLIESGRGP